MEHIACKDIVVYVCHNSIPDGQSLPRQWHQDGAHVFVTEVPCSGKIDAQYLFHALESGGRGVLVVTCPEGECRLSQGNYRARVRIHTVKRLLSEIGLEPERAQLTQCSPDENIEHLVRESIQLICDLDENPIRSAC